MESRRSKLFGIDSTRLCVILKLLEKEFRTVHWSEDYNELRKRRKENGLSQAALARLAGVTRQLIADIESGRRRDWKDVRSRLWEAITDRSIALSRKSKSLVSLDMLRVPDEKDQEKYQAWKQSWAQIQADTDKQLLQEYGSPEKIRGLLKQLGRRDAEIEFLEEQIATLRQQNAALREWLEQEEIAALQTSKARELKEKLAGAGPDATEE